MKMTENALYVIFNRPEMSYTCKNGNKYLLNNIVRNLSNIIY